MAPYLNCLVEISKPNYSFAISLFILYEIKNKLRFFMFWNKYWTKIKQFRSALSEMISPLCVKGGKSKEN